MSNLIAHVEQKKLPDRRRQNKQQVERRRRARINECLDRIKLHVLGAMQKDPTEYDKLEKADILELAVRYLKGIGRKHGGSLSHDAHHFQSLRSSQSHCSSEMSISPVPEVHRPEHQSFIDLNQQLQSHFPLNKNSDQKSTSPADQWSTGTASESQKSIWRPW